MRGTASLLGLLLFLSAHAARAGCDEDLATLKAWHETLREEGPGAPIPLLALSGPSRPSLTRQFEEGPPGRQATLWVSSDGGIAKGWEAPVTGDLQATLRSELDQGRRFLEATSPGNIYSPWLPVGFSPDTPWSTVVRVLTAAEASGIERVILLFAASSKLKTPPPAPNTAAAAQPGNWTSWADGFERCPPLSQLSAAEPRPQRYRTEWLVNAYAECRCAAPLVELQNWAWGIMNRFNSPPVAERLLEWKAPPLARGPAKVGPAKRPKLKLPGKLPWAEAWKTLEPVLDQAPVLQAQ